MEIHLPYLLKAAIAITIFYLVYYLMFRRDKSFLFNRYYLIFSMLISFIIPLITFTEQIIIKETIIPVYSAQVYSSIPTSSLSLTPTGFTRQQILNILFLSGFVFFLTILLTGHFKVWSIVKKAIKKSTHGHSVWITDKDIPPFTYFEKIIIPSSILNNPHIQTVLLHEQIHIKGLHYFDLFITEVLFLFQWFNPFAWLMKKAIRYNIEYLTDNEATNQINQQEYQLGIVSLASKNTFNIFPSVSNQSQLKKRIIMMKTNKQTKFHWIKSLAIIPVLTILTMTLSGREIRIIKTTPTAIEEYAPIVEDKEAVINIIEGNEQINENIIVNENINQEKHQVDDDKVITGKEIHGKVTDLDNNPINGAIVAIKGGTTGVATDSEGKYKLENVAKGSIITFTAFGYEKAEAKVMDLNVFNAQLGTTSTQIASYNEKIPLDTSVYTIIESPLKGNPMVIIDNIPISDNSEIKKLHQDDIESISILKSHVAVSSYGEDAKNGVIIITTKDNNSKPFYMMIDGKKSTVDGIDKINFKIIRTIPIIEDLKNYTGLDLEGVEVKNGVVLITTKKANPKPVYIIDGKTSSSDEFSKLDFKKIDKITILKDQTAKEIYGEAATDGAIIINTKKADDTSDKPVPLT